MTGAGRELAATVVLAASAVLLLPALTEAVDSLSYGAFEYGQHLDTLLSQGPLLLVLFAFVVLGTHMIRTL